ncbi:hypothetical protein RND81_06G122600 [Saponaria officinalis]|uniref:TFIIB-type domain-containing protein n=1 Tax=Saponaria officinalis TaxID=3572 RepID=A0AAW1KAW6_SAPOF
MDLNCPECKRPTEVVYDHGTRNTMCSECGLVLDNNNHQASTSCVSNATSPLIENATLATAISTPSGNKRLKWDEPNQDLVTAFTRLGTMADRLGLVETVKDRSCKLYKKIFYEDNPKTCRARNLDAMLGGCLLVACQEEQLPRTLKEVFSVIKDETTTKKEVMRSKSFLIKQLNAYAANINNNSNNNNNNCGGLGGPPFRRSVIKATDLIKRFCSNLGIVNYNVLKAAQEAAAKCEEGLDLRRSPISVAATVIYVVVQLTEDGEKAAPACLKEIAMATKVAEGTIRNTYKDIYPHAAKIVPDWFANKDKIRDLLCAPSFGGNAWLFT